MADDCGPFVSHVSLLLVAGGKNSSTPRFDLTHTGTASYR